MDTLATFKKFLSDESAGDMYITGQAGTGKTTDLRRLVEYCIANKISYVTCAYTHKACGVLRTKLPEGALVETLHKRLKKCPTINTDALKEKAIQGNAQISTPDIPKVLFIDEFSMVGERDLMSIREMQDGEDDDGEDYLRMKVVWLGDMNQLPPVKDQQTVVPAQPYWCKLTKIYRQAADNPLIEPLTQLVSFIEKRKPPAPLVESDHFIRGCPDLVDAYMSCDADKVFLAYTNHRVQELNVQIQGRNEPIEGDILFCPQNHKAYIFKAVVDPFGLQYVDQLREDPLHWGTKYQSLEYLVQHDFCQFFEVVDEDGEVLHFPVIFGTYNYKRRLEEVGQDAVASNKAIAKAQKIKDAKLITAWARSNWDNPLAKTRSAAWRKYLTHNNNIVCMDFSHAMTVHKSQGSTFETVFLDAQNLALCISQDYDLYLKLMYVALSRASNTVITN